MSAFRNAKCNASYLFWESPCCYLTFIWHFEMLMKCNANISIPGAMQNVNEMQIVLFSYGRPVWKQIVEARNAKANLKYNDYKMNDCSLNRECSVALWGSLIWAVALVLMTSKRRCLHQAQTPVDTNVQCLGIWCNAWTFWCGYFVRPLM